jgi:transposase
MPVSSSRCFAQRSLAVMPPGLQQALGPVLQQIAEMTMKVHDVGHITALTFVLTLGNKERFERSRDVGCYSV